MNFIGVMGEDDDFDEEVSAEEQLARAHLFYEENGLSEEEILRSWGSAMNFMLSYGLKPWKSEDLESARSISMALKDGQRQDEEGEEEDFEEEQRIPLQEQELDLLARAEGWTSANGDSATNMIAYTRNNERLNFWLTTGTVGSYLWHPKKPTKKRTQLFRREITMSEAAAIFNNPRVHTGKGYTVKG